MSFKSLNLSDDLASIVSAINEVVSISSSIFANDNNVRFYKNIATGSVGTDLGGYFQTVYDSFQTSSLASALFDVTYGYSTGSIYNGPGSNSASQDEKTKMYRGFASVLLGDPDATFTINSAARRECFFVAFKRNVQKDEIKKGAVTLTWTSGSTAVTASDNGAVTNFKQAVGGDYAPIKSGSTEVGQVWYNAGIIVVPSDVNWTPATPWSGSLNIYQAQGSGTINNLVDGFRRHIDQVLINNQTNLFSTVYFCRATNSEFNYSSNPTFVDDNQRIVVTSGSNILQTRTYITTVGLYDANDNLLATAKVNKPITKSPDTEAIFRVRLDYAVVPISLCGEFSWARLGLFALFALLYVFGKKLLKSDRYPIVRKLRKTISYVRVCLNSLKNRVRYAVFRMSHPEKLLNSVRARAR